MPIINKYLPVYYIAICHYFIILIFLLSQKSSDLVKWLKNTQDKF